MSRSDAADSLVQRSASARISLPNKHHRLTTVELWTDMKDFLFRYSQKPSSLARHLLMALATAVWVSCRKWTSAAVVEVLLTTTGDGPCKTIAPVSKSSCTA